MPARTCLPLATATFLAALLVWNPGDAAGPDPKTWEAVVHKAVTYLRTTQGEDGSWSREKSVAVPGVVVTGLLETGRVGPSDPMVARAVKYIESLVNPKAGHIAGRDPKVQLQNYVTSINVMALSAAGRDTYKSVIG